jgi:hypothetical protein
MRIGTPACWGRKRDHPEQQQRAETYFTETRNGKHCDSNWYQGNFGFGDGPPFTAPAAALLGFDEEIADFW